MRMMETNTLCARILDKMHDIACRYRCELHKRYLDRIDEAELVLSNMSPDDDAV